VVGKSCVFLASAKALNLATIIQTASIYPFYFSELYKLLREIYKGIFLALLKQSKSVNKKSFLAGRGFFKSVHSDVSNSNTFINIVGLFIFAGKREILNHNPGGQRLRHVYFFLPTRKMT